MALTTFNVTARIFDQDGTALEGAVLTVRLSATDRTSAGAFVSLDQTFTTGSDGTVVMPLVPNSAGLNGTRYLVTCVHPATGALIYDEKPFTVMSGDAFLDALFGDSPVATEAYISTALDTFQGYHTDLIAISGNLATVAGIAAQVVAVGNVNSVNLAAVANVAANVTTVAGVSANVATVAGIAPNVTTVAGISGSVSTVAGLSAAITKLKDIAAAIVATAAISASVEAVAAVDDGIAAILNNMDSVVTCSDNIQTIAIVAANLALNKFDATTDPTANDDSANTSGNGTFSVGSTWINLVDDEAYRCVDATPGAAVWQASTLTIDDLGSMATQNASSVAITGGTASLLNLAVTNTITGSISGNAATVTNGLYSTGTYSNPDWLTSLAATKISGILAQANGGTGTNTWTNNGIVYVNSSGALTSSAGLQFDGTVLQLGASTGKNLILYSGTGYGFGVQSNLLEITTNGATADCVIGYGASGSVTPFARFSSTGITAIGISSPGSGLFSERFGESASTSTFAQALSVGAAATVTGLGGTAVGRQAASAGNGVALGYAANASASSDAIAIGYQAVASGQYGVAIGRGTSAGSFESVSIGAFNNATLPSIMIGYGMGTAAAGDIILGVGNRISEIYLGAGKTAAADYGTRLQPSSGSSAGVLGGTLRIAGGKGGDAATSGGPVIIQTANSGAGTTLVDRVIVTPAGNLGLGVTPSAWKEDQVAFQVGFGGAVWSNSAVSNLISGSNTYFTGAGVFTYVNSGSATRYDQYLGEHTWHTAPSGTAGAAITFTQAMTLDASGNLFLGGTSFAVAAGERASITTASALGVGIKTTTGLSSDLPLSIWNTNTDGDARFQFFYTEGTATARGSITYNRGAGAVAYNTTSDYRAKDVFGEYESSGEVIDALTVHLGKMKGSTLTRPMFIAHELQEHLPYAVTGTKDAANDDGSPIYQQLDHSSLVPLLTAEVKQLRKRIAVLEAA